MSVPGPADEHQHQLQYLTGRALHLTHPKASRAAPAPVSLCAGTTTRVVALSLSEAGGALRRALLCAGAVDPGARSGGVLARTSAILTQLQFASSGTLTMSYCSEGRETGGENANANADAPCLGVPHAVLSLLSFFTQFVEALTPSA